MTTTIEWPSLLPHSIILYENEEFFQRLVLVKEENGYGLSIDCLAGAPQAPSLTADEMRQIAKKILEIVGDQ